MNDLVCSVKNGELYKSVEVEGVRFDIYYGYESENVKRLGWEPTPQYPDFNTQPTFSPQGKRFTLTYGEICNDYQPISKTTERICCQNCKLFNKKEEYIGLCESKNRARR